MANYPDKNLVTEKGVVTPYLNAYGKAFTERFNANEDIFFDAAPASYVATPVVFAESAPAKKVCRYKKNPVAIVITLILSLLVLAAAAISYIGVEAISKYLTIYGTGTIDTIVTNTINMFKDGATDVLAYVVNIGLLAGIVIAFCIVISAIAGLASKRRILFWVAALIMVLLTIASAVCYYLSLDGVSFADFLAPTGDYLQIGFFAILGLQVLTLIVSCFANRKVCK